jgi:hypothetical protein
MSVLAFCLFTAGCGGGLTGVAPEITTQPQNLSAARGATVSFSVVVKSDLPVSYQWRRNGLDIPGAVNGSYSLVAATADNGANFSVLVTNVAGFELSRAAVLTVVEPGAGG